MTTNRVQNLISAYVRAEREGKKVVAAKTIAEAITGLESTAEVDEFVRRVRQHKGVQDLALIGADKPYHIEVKADGAWHTVHNPASPGQVASLASNADGGFQISFPSVYSHWGYAIFWNNNGRDYRAFSADYQMTETYMSS